MSASPSGMSNGGTPTPNGGPPQYVRKAKPTDPLRPRKKPIRRPNVPTKPAAPNANGQLPGRAPYQPPINGAALSQSFGQRKQGPTNGTPVQQSVDGWTHAPPGQGQGTTSYQDFPLYTTKRAIREGLRYHIARFAGKKNVDPSNQNEFIRPVVLHRRDPHQPPGRNGVKDEDIKDGLPIDSKERERLEILKAEKEKQRAIDLAQIAPSGTNTATAKKPQAFRNEKTTQVHRLDKNEEEKKASDLKYEEALPWHLEDAENKNIWVGNYEAALSDTNVLLVVDGDKFQMIPVEKWYKFQAKGQFKAYTIEEAEAQLSKKVRESRWVMKDNEKKEQVKAMQDTRKSLHSLYTVKSESATAKAAGKGERMDMDDLDFDADDLFQDDDEQATFEPDNDEETKETQVKIKREMLAANVFDQAVEAEVEKELELESKEKSMHKLEQKRLRKALKKRERNYLYDSDDSDRNPYSDESDDDTSDEEKQKEIDRKKDEETKNKAKLESKDPKDKDGKLASGASSKGNNTPSGRPKNSDPLNSKNRKRPGSPNLSESSGNESTLARKKHRKKHHQTGNNTPMSGSRAGSPVPIKMEQDGQSGPLSARPMSDAETGGEMSDGSRARIKLRIGGKQTPSGSRAGSPAPGRAGSVGAGGSRAGTPAPQLAKPTGSTSPSKIYPPGEGPIQPSELIASTPPEGIAAGVLMKKFSSRVGEGNRDKTSKAEFVFMVKQYLKYGPDKLLRPK